MNAIAFRIRDFRSIVDSGVCTLSGDGISVLAGQNEAGKTAVLSALRDFDLQVGEAPETPEYLPEGHFDARPKISVEFSCDPVSVLGWLTDDSKKIPGRVLAAMAADPKLWVERDVLEGSFHLDPKLAALWPSDGEAEGAGGVGQAVSGEEMDFELLSAEEFAAFLRDYWPKFVYFDSFQDSLPRQVDVASLSSPIKAPAEVPAQPGRKTAPQSVRDFVTLSGMDIRKVLQLADQDKALGNYLQTCATGITGDFLTYWKQKTDGSQRVDLLVRHTRDQEGALRLAFYVHDKADLYPEQRSKGFLWFLSFYLRLAAEHKREPDRKRLLLIDEPGSYLHARAQKDVLHLLEQRIAEKDQVIYSTHSPFLIPPDRLHRLRVVLKSADKGTLVLDRLTHPELRGEAFADTLSPVIASIGLDIREALSFAKPKNLIVEGITDHFYLMAWAKYQKSDLFGGINLFPGFGASTVPVLASLFVGWGLEFAALVDRDSEGLKARERLIKELAVPESRVLQPRDALTIEDILSKDDFSALLTAVDPSLVMNVGESPSAAIKRLGIDKVLVARTFSSQVESGSVKLTKKSQDAIDKLLKDIAAVL